MSRLGVAVLPLDGKQDTFSIFEISPSGKYLVGVRKHSAVNVIYVYYSIAYDVGERKSNKAGLDGCNALFRIVCHLKAISSIALYSIEEEDYLMALSIDGFLSAWNLSKKECICAQDLQLSDDLEKLFVDVTSNRVLITGVSGSLYCLNYNDFSYVFSISSNCSNGVESLLCDKADPNIVYSLSRNGIITSWDLSNKRVISNISIPTVANATAEVTNSRSVNSLYWFEDRSYLILFRGVLYYWNATTLDVLFCSLISHYNTNPELLQIIRVCVLSSLVFVAYQTMREDVLLSFSKEQCSLECDESNPLFHVHPLLSCPADFHIISIINCGENLTVLGKTMSGPHSISVIRPRSSIPTSVRRESTHETRTARLSGGSYSMWGVSRGSEFMNAEQFENGWEKGSFQDRLQHMLTHGDEGGSDDVMICDCGTVRHGSESDAALSADASVCPSQSVSHEPSQCGSASGSQSVSQSASQTTSQSTTHDSSSSSSCRYCCRYSLSVSFSTSLHIDESNTSIYPMPSSPTSPPLFFLCGDDGVVSMWRLDWLMQLWSLNVCDEITTVAVSQFGATLTHTHIEETIESDDSSSLVSNGHTHSLLSHHSYSGSIPFSDSTFGPSPHCTIDTFIMSSLFTSASSARFPEGIYQHPQLQSNLIAIGTARGRLLLFDSIEGKILLDTNVMDSSLDFVLMSGLYGEKDGDQEGFILTCGNQSGVCYSLYLVYDPLAQNVESAGLFLLPDEMGKGTPLSDVSRPSSSTLVDRISSCSISPAVLRSAMYPIASSKKRIISGLCEFFAGLFYLKEDIISMFFQEGDSMDKIRICLNCKQSGIRVFSLDGEEDVMVATMLKMHESGSWEKEVSTKLSISEVECESHYPITSISTAAMLPLYIIQLPFSSILQHMAELAEFLAEKGLVDGWDQLPVNVLGSTTTWNDLLRYMNILMPWNQDSSLNKQLVKLFSFSPYCVTLDHPCFRLALYSPDFQSLLVGREVCNNDDGSLFLKLFKQSKQITTLLLLQYPLLSSHILSILLKLNSVSDSLKSFLTTFILAILTSTHSVPASPSSPSPVRYHSSFSSQRFSLVSPRSPQLCPADVKGIDLNTLARYFYFNNSKYYRKASETILQIIMGEYAKNNWPVAPLLTQLLNELKKTKVHTDEFYSLLMCILMMLQDEITLATEDESFLLDTISDVVKDPDCPSVLLDKLLIGYLILHHGEDDQTITSIINMIYSRSMPGSELLTRLLTMVSDTFVRELVHIVKDPVTMPKGVRSIFFLLHTSPQHLIPYADNILDALIVAKRIIITQEYSDLRFIATINLKSVMNKTIRYKDVRNNPRDANYFTILSSFLLLSSLPTVYIDNYYAFAVSHSGVLHVYSLPTAVLLCSTSIHSMVNNKIQVFTTESTASPSSMNRNQNYYILSLSRSERIMSFYLFNDRRIPYKTVLRQLRYNRFTYKDYSSISLMKVAMLFIPCNSTIQSESCSLCRRHRHKSHMSEFFIFQGRNTSDSENISRLDGLEQSIIPTNNMDDIDFSSLPLGTILYGKHSKKPLHEQQPLIHSEPKCCVCRNPIEPSSSKRSYRWCSCLGMDHLVITPQSLMPTSFSQDCTVTRHLPPNELIICQNCKNLILCGNQLLSPSELNNYSPDSNSWGYTGVSQTRLNSFRTGGMSLSALLAHVGHGVDDRIIDQDFQLRIEPWGTPDGMKPDAFRIYLQLTDLVIVWYDVLVKDIVV